MSDRYAVTVLPECEIGVGKCELFREAVKRKLACAAGIIRNRLAGFVIPVISGKVEVGGDGEISGDFFVAFLVLHVDSVFAVA